VTTDDLIRRVRAAHADAWEIEGRARERYGGGAARVQGTRLMASGLPEAKWNNADVTDASVDVSAIRRWYEPRGIPWGLRVPVEIELDFGRPLFVKRCVALFPGGPVRRASSVSVSRERDESVFSALESAAFDYELAAARAWVRPQFGHPAFRHWVATVDGVPAAIGTTIRTNGDAGPASYLTGLASLVEPAGEALRALVDVASADAYSGGAAFIHTNPESEGDDEILASHDPLEVPGLLIRVAA
jgi:hypothetical protein